MGGGPLLVVFGVWAAVGGVCAGFYLVEDEPTVWAVPEGPVVGSILPGVPPVHEPSPDYSEAGVADDLPSGVRMCRLAFKEWHSLVPHVGAYHHQRNGGKHDCR